MNQRSIKRSFPEIRKEIMLSLSQGQKTVNKLANDSGINWKTVNNHLIYLMGSGLVNEVLSTPYVKIFKRDRQDFTACPF